MTTHYAKLSPALQGSELYLEAFRFMLLARAVDDKLASLYRGGKINGGVYLGRGQEALSVAIGISLLPGDVFSPLIRDGGGRLAFGEPLLDGFRTYFGSAAGPMRGRDGNIHRGRPKEGMLPMISHLGAMISVVNGMLLARRFQKREGTVGAACIGEGGSSTGAWHEALNQAAVEKLPLIVVLADNQYAYSTPSSRQFACKNLVDRAIGYGIEGHTVDATDLEACLRVVGGAVEKARGGAGPQLVVGRFLRLCGHGEHDDANYIDPKCREAASGRDCLKVAEQFILEKKLADASLIEEWRAENHTTIETAVATVQRESGPDPYHETWQALSTARLVEGFGDE